MTKEQFQKLSSLWKEESYQKFCGLWLKFETAVSVKNVESISKTFQEAAMLFFEETSGFVDACNFSQIQILIDSYKKIIAEFNENVKPLCKPKKPVKNNMDPTKKGEELQFLLKLKEENIFPDQINTLGKLLENKLEILINKRQKEAANLPINVFNFPEDHFFSRSVNYAYSCLTNVSTALTNNIKKYPLLSRVFFYSAWLYSGYAIRSYLTSGDARYFLAWDKLAENISSMIPSSFSDVPILKMEHLEQFSRQLRQIEMTPISVKFILCGLAIFSAWSFEKHVLGNNDLVQALDRKSFILKNNENLLISQLELLEEREEKLLNSNSKDNAASYNG